MGNFLPGDREQSVGLKNLITSVMTFLECVFMKREAPKKNLRFSGLLSKVQQIYGVLYVPNQKNTFLNV